MPELCSFRQVDEKHVGGDVLQMTWSPKMDLMAIAVTSGEVILYRLSMQKVWTLRGPTDVSEVTAMAWRPDGKVLAVGYDDHDVILCDVENAEILHTVCGVDHVTCLQWVVEMPSSEVSKQPIFVERSSEFLPKLPALHKGFSAIKGSCEENIDDPKRLKNQNLLNMLVIGNESGCVRLLVFGLFTVAHVDLNSLCNFHVSRIANAMLSNDLRLLSVIAETSDGQLCLVSLDTTVLSERRSELCIVAHKFGQISSLLSYLQSSLKQMQEAWEDILLEMDSKLVKFEHEKRKTSGTVCNDFLELLMFGMPSDELRNFLIHDLTDKGLKKLGHSIETSYSNAEKIILKQVHSCSEELLCHLGELRGMTRWREKFGVLGLDEELINAAISSVGAFLIKAGELHHVIQNSLKNFKAFFRWLYVAILRLADEQIPSELSKSSQQTYDFVAEFLTEYFTLEETDGKHSFKLERVGQYLKNKDLYKPPTDVNKDWLDFLEKNPECSTSGLLHPVEHGKSLIQVHEKMEKSIDLAFSKSMEIVRGHFLLDRNCLLRLKSSDHSLGSTKIAQFSACTDKDGEIYILCMPDPAPANCLYLFSMGTDRSRESMMKAYRFRIGEICASNGNASDRCQDHRVLDIAFYDAKIISALLLEQSDDGLPVLAQVALSAVFQAEACDFRIGTSEIVLDELPCTDIGPHLYGINSRKLENMKAVGLAVSGTRKVASVLFSSRRRVRLFLMDVEDDDDDDVNETEADTTAPSGMDDSQLNVTDKSGDGEDKENTSFTSGDTGRDSSF